MKYLLCLCLFLSSCSLTKDVVKVDPQTLKYSAGTHIGGGTGFYKNCQGIIKDFYHYMDKGGSPNYIIAWNCPNVQGFLESIVSEKDMHE